MEWSQNLRTLHRGVQLATRIVRSKLEELATDEQAVPPAHGRLVRFEGFGDNPGKLQMLAHLPAVRAGRPLVVLLHGCGQDAAAFAADSGWGDLADRLHIPLILPQQADANNAGRCFQWFHPGDTSRDHGEAGSIASMTRAAISRFGSDASRVFVVGLSAGAAMAAALLSAYPDVFAAGAAVAGLPVGSARSGMQALLRMASAGMDTRPETWAAHNRAIAPAGFNGTWPRLSIWQGQADTTVAPENAMLLAQQWQALLDVGPQDMAERVSGRVTHQVWSKGHRRVLELWSLEQMAHAYPVGGRSVVPGRFMEQASVDATASIARFFGLD